VGADGSAMCNDKEGHHGKGGGLACAFDTPMVEGPRGRGVDRSASQRCSV
jgi:hypothetical protein